MQVIRWHAFIALSAVLMTGTVQAKPRPDAHFGNVLFKTPNPAKWHRSLEGGRLTFSAAVPSPDFVTLTVFPGSRTFSSFRGQFVAAVNRELQRLGVTKITRDGGLQLSKAAEGFPVLQQVLIGETARFHTTHWFVAGHPGNRFDMVAFQTSGEETYKLYGAEAGAFFSSVKFANSLAPGFSAGAQPGNPAAAAPHTGPWKIGDKVEAWDVMWHKSTIVGLGSGAYAGYFRVQEDGDHGFEMVSAANIRALSGPPPSTAGGPRAGRYVILSYGDITNPLRIGYFILSGSSYQYLSAAGRHLGGGKYSYTAGKVKWLSGPFKTAHWDGKFRIEREGKTHIIQLNTATVGSNSTDSANR